MYSLYLEHWSRLLLAIGYKIIHPRNRSCRNRRRTRQQYPCIHRSRTCLKSPGMPHALASERLAIRSLFISFTRMCSLTIECVLLHLAVRSLFISFFTKYTQFYFSCLAFPLGAYHTPGAPPDFWPSDLSDFTGFSIPAPNNDFPIFTTR